MTPAWRIPPPRSLRARRALSIRSRDEATTDPTGAHRPFDRQAMTVSTPFTSAAGGTPRATAAFQTRAPSRCTRKPHSRAAATTAWNSSTPWTVPPPRLCVFSSTTRLTSDL